MLILKTKLFGIVLPKGAFSGISHRNKNNKAAQKQARCQKRRTENILYDFIYIMFKNTQK